MRGKIFIPFCFLFITHLVLGSKTEAQLSLHQADSLFKEKKYTEAIFFYDSLFHQENVYTPQMLRKLSFIEEGLGNYQKTLFYLSYLQFWHPNEDIALKLNELAEKHNLSGYSSEEIDLLYQYYSTYKQPSIIGLTGFIFLLVLLIMYYKIAKKRTNSILILFAMLLLGVLYYAANFNPFPKRAIISKPNSLFMNEASSASQLVETGKQGNRIEVLGESDDWYFVQLNDTTAYVKKGQLEVVE